MSLLDRDLVSSAGQFSVSSTGTFSGSLGSSALDNKPGNKKVGMIGVGL